MPGGMLALLVSVPYVLCSMYHNDKMEERR